MKYIPYYLLYYSDIMNYIPYQLLSVLGKILHKSFQDTNANT